MQETVPARVRFVESIAQLRLPPMADQRLQTLMDENTEGRLTNSEKAELAALAEWSEELSLLRAEAFSTLGAKPA